MIGLYNSWNEKCKGPKTLKTIQKVMNQLAKLSFLYIRIDNKFTTVGANIIYTIYILALKSM